jgi:hypothetical protein
MRHLGLNPWNLTVGALIGAALFVAGVQIRSWFPPIPPVEATALKYWLSADGKTQYFQADLTVREVCHHVVFDRVFVSLQGVPFRRHAVEAPFDPQPVVPVVLKPGVYPALRWAYRTEPDVTGTFRLWVSPNECESGYNQTFSLFNAPFDWRETP